MKHITVIIAFLLVTLFCYGQKEYLKPARDFNQYEGVLKEYYDNVFPLLYKGFTDKSYARYTSMPSFSKEYAFSIELRENNYYIISNNLSENYWYAKKRNKVKIEIHQTKISKTLYLKIGKLFQLLAKQIKKAEDDFGDDGVTYYFSVTDSNGAIKTRETWSPNDNSLLGRLVKICDKLYYKGKGMNISETELMNEIEELIINLNE